MPVKYTRLSKNKVNKIMRCFCADLGSTQTAKLTGINRNTVNDWYQTFRIEIAGFQEAQVKQSSGSFELDESYFGGMRKKLHAKDRRKRGRGAENKIPVFGIKKRDDGAVYTKIIENASKQYSDRKGNHINGIENFWAFSKQRLSKFHGISRKNFYYHLKECEFRYNKKHDMMKVLRRVIRGLLV